MEQPIKEKKITIRQDVEHERLCIMGILCHFRIVPSIFGSLYPEVSIYLVSHFREKARLRSTAST